VRNGKIGEIQLGSAMDRLCMHQERWGEKDDHENDERMDGWNDTIGETNGMSWAAVFSSHKKIFHLSNQTRPEI